MYAEGSTIGAGGIGALGALPPLLVLADLAEAPHPHLVAFSAPHLESFCVALFCVAEPLLLLFPPQSRSQAKMRSSKEVLSPPPFWVAAFAPQSDAFLSSQPLRINDRTDFCVASFCVALFCVALLPLQSDFAALAFAPQSFFAAFAF